jgi:hypothetical protein
MTSPRVGRERSGRGFNEEVGNFGILKMPHEKTCAIGVDLNVGGFRAHWKWRRDNRLERPSFPLIFKFGAVFDLPVYAEHKNVREMRARITRVRPREQEPGGFGIHTCERNQYR